MFNEKEPSCVNYVLNDINFFTTDFKNKTNVNYVINMLDINIEKAKLSDFLT